MPSYPHWQKCMNIRYRKFTTPYSSLRTAQGQCSFFEGHCSHSFAVLREKTKQGLKCALPPVLAKLFSFAPACKNRPASPQTFQISFHSFFDEQRKPKHGQLISYGEDGKEREKIATAAAAAARRLEGGV